jgi:hypothetical protein
MTPDIPFKRPSHKIAVGNRKYFVLILILKKHHWRNKGSIGGILLF